MAHAAHSHSADPSWPLSRDQPSQPFSVQASGSQHQSITAGKCEKAICGPQTGIFVFFALV